MSKKNKGTINISPKGQSDVAGKPFAEIPVATEPYQSTGVTLEGDLRRLEPEGTELSTEYAKGGLVPLNEDGKLLNNKQMVEAGLASEPLHSGEYDPKEAYKHETPDDYLGGNRAGNVLKQLNETDGLVDVSDEPNAVSEFNMAQTEGDDAPKYAVVFTGGLEDLVEGLAPGTLTSVAYNRDMWSVDEIEERFMSKVDTVTRNTVYRLTSEVSRERLRQLRDDAKLAKSAHIVFIGYNQFAFHSQAGRFPTDNEVDCAIAVNGPTATLWKYRSVDEAPIGKPVAF